MFMMILIGYVIISVLTLRSLVVYETRTCGRDVDVINFLGMVVFSCVPLLNIVILITFTFENWDSSNFRKKYNSSIFRKVMFEKREG